jgi:Methylase involved in ubiquinone/menaquinone biosynthesis
MFTGNRKQIRKGALISGLALCLGAASLPVLAHQIEHNSSAAEHKHGYHKEFKGIDYWVKVFDDPKRDKWQRPEKVVSALNVEPKQIVADIGAGTGYFSFRIAKSQPEAKVYAADVEKEMVDYLTKVVKERAIPNVIPFQIKPGTPDLPERIDLALVVDTYHHIDDRVSYFSELRSRLRPDGRVAIIDFTMDSPEGPPRKHRILKEDLVKELSAAGFCLDNEVDELPYQYFLIFKPTTATVSKRSSIEPSASTPKKTKRSNAKPKKKR